MIVQAGNGGRRHGAVLLEMAIVLPFLAFAFLVALDFCRAYCSSQTVQNCASVAALYASGVAKGTPGTSTEDAAKQAAVAEGAKLNPPLQLDNVAVTLGDDTVSVTVSYDFSMITGFPGFARSYKLVRTVIMPTAPKVGR